MIRFRKPHADEVGSYGNTCKYAVFINRLHGSGLENDNGILGSFLEELLTIAVIRGYVNDAEAIGGSVIAYTVTENETPLYVLSLKDVLKTIYRDRPDYAFSVDDEFIDRHAITKTLTFKNLHSSSTSTTFSATVTAVCLEA